MLTDAHRSPDVAFCNRHIWPVDRAEHLVQMISENPMIALSGVLSSYYDGEEIVLRPVRRFRAAKQAFRMLLPARSFVIDEAHARLYSHSSRTR